MSIYNNPKKYTIREDGQIRVQIISVAGTEVAPGLIGADPDAAKAVMNQEGWCEEDAQIPGERPGRTNPKITLDSGKVIWGYECWWKPIERDTWTAEEEKAEADRIAIENYRAQGWVMQQIDGDKWAAWRTDEAEGAWPNGSVVRKTWSEEGDAHPTGTLGTIVGSMGPMSADEVTLADLKPPEGVEYDPNVIYAYWVRWDDTGDQVAMRYVSLEDTDDKGRQRVPGMVPVGTISPKLTLVGKFGTIQ